MINKYISHLITILILMNLIICLDLREENQNGHIYCNEGTNTGNYLERTLKKTLQKPSSFSLVQFSEHDPISIHRNEDFHNQAAEEGWDMEGTRDGTASKPYVIDGYEITNSSSHLIEIENTTLFFYISNNLLNGKNGSFDAIFLYNVTHGVITDNSIYNCKNGVNFSDHTANSTIFSNKLFNNSNAIGLFYVNSNSIYSNIINNNSYQGICLWNSNANTLSDNIITYNSYQGICLWNSSANILSNNIIANNSDDGIAIYGNNNTITANFISNNNFDGIRLFSAMNNSLFNNFISINGWCGTCFYFDTHRNSIFNNTFLLNEKQGIYFSYFSTSNKINWNEFLGNNLGESSQAFDAGSNNAIRFNYWNEWITPDNNSDGIVDDPYPIEGNANNSDPFPLVFSKNTITIEVISTSEISGKNSASGWMYWILFFSMFALILIRRALKLNS